MERSRGSTVEIVASKETELLGYLKESLPRLRVLKKLDVNVLSQYLVEIMKRTAVGEVKDELARTMRKFCSEDPEREIDRFLGALMGQLVHMGVLPAPAPMRASTAHEPYGPLSTERRPSPSSGKRDRPGPSHEPPAQRRRPEYESVLRVRCIPREHNTCSSLFSYFSRYGAISRIELHPASNEANVHFVSPSCVAGAIADPTAAFGSRFVRILMSFGPLEAPADELVVQEYDPQAAASFGGMMAGYPTPPEMFAMNMTRGGGVGRGRGGRGGHLRGGGFHAWSPMAMPPVFPPPGFGMMPPPVMHEMMQRPPSTRPPRKPATESLEKRRADLRTKLLALQQELLKKAEEETDEERRAAILVEMSKVNEQLASLLALDKAALPSAAEPAPVSESGPGEDAPPTSGPDEEPAESEVIDEIPIDNFGPPEEI